MTLPQITLETCTADMAILINEELSANIGMTDEGYLICKNVPVARTGVQYYMGSELGLTGEYAGRRIKIYREAEDVFSKDTLKSLESKPVTDDHPTEDVNIHNISIYRKGHGRNVRHDDKFIYTELIIDDATLISKIRSKKKYQISLGYRCRYIPFKDGYKQIGLHINHIAVVEAGRAGPQVSIKDKLPQLKGVSKIMDKQTAINQMFIAFAQSAPPEEVAKVLPYVTTTDAAPVKETGKEASEMGLLGKLVAMLSTRDAKAKDEDPEEKEDEKETSDALAAKIDKLVGDAITKHLGKLAPAKDERTEIEKLFAEDEDPDKEMTEDDDEEEEEKKASDSMEKALKVFNPVIAKLPEAQRKAVKDELRKALKPNAGKGTYAAIQKAIKTHTKDADNAPSIDPTDIGEHIKRTRNPQYMKNA